MKVTFVGAGAMAGAIAVGANTKNPEQWDFTFYDLNQKAATNLAERTGGSTAGSLEEAVDGADMIVLAVKPQHQPAVVSALPKTDATIVSIAAGRTTEQIQDDFGAETAIVRVMPNVNALVGAATSAICKNEAATEHELALVKELFDSVGTTTEIPENLFSAFTALAGSSPAFFFQIVEHLARAGVAEGLTKTQALDAALGSMLGSALLLQDALASGDNTTDMIDRVSSPGGTTIAGLLAAEDAGLGPALVAAVKGTVARDAELGE